MKKSELIYLGFCILCYLLWKDKEIPNFLWLLDGLFIGISFTLIFIDFRKKYKDQKEEMEKKAKTIINNVIEYIEEDQWTKYYKIQSNFGEVRIVGTTNGDIIHKKCPKCNNDIVLTFYEKGVFISAFKTQIRINPIKQLLCEKCDPNIFQFENCAWDDPLLQKRLTQKENEL